MALDFPASPTAGQTYVGTNGVTYQWNATYTAWIPITGPFATPVDFNCIFSGTVGFPSTPTTVTSWSVTSGNAGGWYNPANGRFTPPPGRYHIFCGFDAGSTAGAAGMYVYLRKNGTTVLQSGMVTGSASWWGECEVQSNFDANGTDWFDVQGSSGSTTNMGGMYAWFGAFALPGGAQAASGIGSAWRQIGRIVPTANLNSVDFPNLPSDINDLEVRWDCQPLTASGQALTFFDNTGAADATTGHYAWSCVRANHSMAAGSNALGEGSSSIATNLIALMGAVAPSTGQPAQGRATINNIRDTSRVKVVNWQNHFLDSGNTVWVGVNGNGIRNVAGLITGVRLGWAAANNFAAGGAVTLWGSP